jgi:hypothetical protein
VFSKLVSSYVPAPASNVNVFSIPGDPTVHEHAFAPRRANAPASATGPVTGAPVTTTAPDTDTGTAAGEPAGPDTDAGCAGDDTADDTAGADRASPAAGTAPRDTPPPRAGAADATAGHTTDAISNPHTSTSKRRITTPPQHTPAARQSGPRSATGHHTRTPIQGL